MIAGVSTPCGASAPTVAQGPEGLRALVGGQLAPSGWHLVSQDRVNQFAAATGDGQWIHVDEARAAVGPFGTTIAHGYFTLCLTPVVLSEILDVQGFSLVVNYGCDRVRFPSPVPVGSRLRAGAVIDEVREIDGGVHVGLTLTFEAEDAAKPACVARILIRYYT